jgi:hypothetical protein
MKPLVAQEALLQRLRSLYRQRSVKSGGGRGLSRRKLGLLRFESNYFAGIALQFFITTEDAEDTENGHFMGNYGVFSVSL